MDQQEQKPEVFNLLAIQKWHYIVAIVIAIGTPLVTGYAAYIKTTAAVETKFVEVRLEVEQKYAKKDDIQRLEVKLDKISDDVAEMKGYLLKKR